MNGFDDSVLSLLVVLPFATALALILWPGDSDQLRSMKWFSAVVALVSTALVAWILLRFDYTDGSQYQFISETAWLDQLGIGFDLGVDGIAVAMLALTAIAFPAAILVGWNVDARSKDYLILLNLLVGGVYGTFVSLDLFFLFFFYEIAVLPMYLLIGFWGSSTSFPRFTRSKEYSAMKLVLFLVGGSVLIWVSIIAMFVEADLNSFSLLDLQRAGFDESFQNWVFPLLMIGFGLLGGLWPLHTWSPDGHVSAPTSVSMLHAGVLMKLGAFGIIRVGIQTIPEGAEAWAPLLLGMGAVNVIYGSIAAMSQTDLKYVIGYSSVSHMGYVFLGLATMHTLGVTGAVLQMFSHGIMTALMFTLAGAVRLVPHARHRGAQRAGKGHAGRRVLLCRRRFRVAWPARVQRIRGRVAGLPRFVPDLPVGRRACGNRRRHHRRVHASTPGESVLRRDRSALGVAPGSQAQREAGRRHVGPHAAHRRARAVLPDRYHP